MKKAISQFITLLLISALGFAQTIENLDFVAPFNNDVAAIKKDNQWGFINKKGDIIVTFRSDLVLSKTPLNNYPIFKNNRCLMSVKKNGIAYYGYIDKTGKTVIKPQFLNATPFNNNRAIALQLVKENIGRNDLLDKNIVYYKYFEVTIDTSGSVLHYLTQKGVNISLDKKLLSKPPAITTQLLSDDLYTVLNKNKTWSIIKINK